MFRFIILFFSFPLFLFAQQNKEGSIRGNFQTDFQVLQEDTLISAYAEDFPEKFLYMAFGNLTYTKGDFQAGIRFESYESPLLGYPSGYTGNTGIPYRYISYKVKDLTITLGNYYEQFGSGLIFRTYEERNLGYDNAMEGVKLEYEAINGIKLKGIIGKQRSYFEKGNGVLRGLDIDISLNDLIKKWENCKTQIVLGSGFISKYEEDRNPTYKLPENVGAWANRLTINRGFWNFYSEYAYKINDPSAVNNYIYKPGNALVFNTTYAKKGLGILLSAKRIDNMNFRSEVNAQSNDLLINYLPAFNKQHTYSLPALYPYATQANGEIGLQAEIIYKLKKGSFLGGKYGTNISVNFSNAHAIDKTPINDTVSIGQSGTLGYESNFLKIGDEKYFQDINIEISKKVSKKFSFIASYINIYYNKDIIEDYNEYGSINGNIIVLDGLYKIKPMHSLRFEYQHMLAKQEENTSPERGDWVMGLIEYTFAPHWFIAVQDQFNYGNPIENKQLHYYTISIGYTKGANRFILNYGKQQEGIFCVGGVCRNVPASSGFSMSITSSF